MQLNQKCFARFLPALLCLVTLLLAGCGNAGSPTSSSKPQAAPKAQQVFRIGVPNADIASFDPGTATDALSLQAITDVFTGLVTLNDSGQVSPQLAQSYDVSPDGLTYTFHLRTGLKFSDGTPLNANDVAYSIDRALSPAVSDLNGVTQTYLGLIKDSSARINGQKSTLIGDSINVIDTNTISLTVSEKTAYFLDALTYPTSFVVEQSVINKWGTNWTNHLNDNHGQGGAGPFKVLSYSHTTGIILVPNTNYYGPIPQLQRVELDFFQSAQASYAAYQANQLDWTTIPAGSVLQAQTDTREFHKFNELTIDYLGLNYLYKPFDNIHIRQAFELAINKDVISKAIYNGFRLPTCHIVPQGMPGYNANLTCPDGAPTKGDPTKAKLLFQEGLQEEGLTLATFPRITITYQSNVAALADEITTIRQEWQQVLGVTTTIQVLDFNALLQLGANSICTQIDLTKCLNKGIQIGTAAWGADYPDPQDWLTLQFDKGAPNNGVNYGQNLTTAASEQQQVQLLLERADGDLGADRLSLYNQAEQLLVNDVAWLPIDQRVGNYLQKSYVYGTVDTAIGVTAPAPNDWGRIYIARH